VTGSEYIMTAGMLTERVASLRLSVQSNERPKQRIQLKTPKVRIHIDNAKALNRVY
jgi:hypothetical protein